MRSEDLDTILERLRLLGLPARVASKQTAICVLALLDRTGRDGLISGKTCLHDGARIHDILQFARQDLGIEVAENTRESYRKGSLNPLREYGIVDRHQLSTNDPNTFYRLRHDAERVFRADPAKLDRALAERRSEQTIRRLEVPDESVVVDLGGATITLTRGAHHFLEKQIVENLVPRVLAEPTILYVGDTAKKTGFQNRKAMRELNLPIDVAASLPDVIAADLQARVIVVAEAVTSSGPISATRRLELEELVRAARDLDYDVVYITAFLDRKTLRKFVEEIAWGTRVWISEEPEHIAWFNGPV